MQRFHHKYKSSSKYGFILQKIKRFFII
jgi:hypothetical protein